MPSWLLRISGRSYPRSLDRTTSVERTSPGTHPATLRGHLYVTLASNVRNPGAVHTRQVAHRSDTIHHQNERSVPHMNRLRSVRAIVLAAVLLVVGQVLSMPLSVAASAGEPPTVPEAIAVPPGSVLLFSSH